MASDQSQTRQQCSPWEVVLTNSLAESMAEFQQQLQAGAVQHAYRSLIEYFRELRRYMAKSNPGYSVSASIYQGVMDMTYFAVTPDFLQRRNLKCPIVFDYDNFDFKVWLSGANRDIQVEYWTQFKEVDWVDVQLCSDPRREDFIVSRTLVPSPDFGDLEGLSASIDQGVQQFLVGLNAKLSQLEG